MKKKNKMGPKKQEHEQIYQILIWENYKLWKQRKLSNRAADSFPSKVTVLKELNAQIVCTYTCQIKMILKRSMKIARNFE